MGCYGALESLSKGVLSQAGQPEVRSFFFYHALTLITAYALPIVFILLETIGPIGQKHCLRIQEVHFRRTCVAKKRLLFASTGNNQRLQSAGDNDGRSKRFCSNAVLCVSFTWQMVKTRVIRLRGIEGRNARDQIAFCAFHYFLMEVLTITGYIHATHA